MIVIRLQIWNTLTYFLEEVLLFHLDKWWSFFCACFAILEYADQFIVKKIMNPQQESLQNKFWEYILQNYCFTREKHIEKGLIFAIKIVVNIFYNNKQKVSSDEVGKNTVECFLKKAKVQRKSILKRKC